MPTMKTADELIASVDATLDGWRVALDSSLSQGNETVALEAAAAADNKKTYLWEDSDKYFERLATFKPDHTLQNRWQYHLWYVLHLGE